MAENTDSLSPVHAPGLRVSLEQSMHVASLRHFDPSGEFSSAVRRTMGVALPETLRATEAAQHAGVKRTVLAWRSPTETLLLCADEAVIVQLDSDAATLQDGCVVDQTGGLRVLGAIGEGIVDLFARMGGQTVLPSLGEARRSRLADIPVLALQVQPNETLLVVERVYAEHLIEWMRSSAAQFGAM